MLSEEQVQVAKDCAEANSPCCEKCVGSEAETCWEDLIAALLADRDQLEACFENEHNVGLSFQAECQKLRTEVEQLRAVVRAARTFLANWDAGLIEPSGHAVGLMRDALAALEGEK